MKAVATVAAVAAVVVAATAGLSGPGRAAPSADAACMPQRSHAPAIGRFLRVDPGAALGKSALQRNDPRKINTDSTLCTYLPFGQIEFVVDPKITCWMDPGSRVRVYPPAKAGNKQVVVRFEDGPSTWCNTGTATKDSKFDANTGKVRLIMRDPLFSVGRDSEQNVMVKVQLGYVEVSKLAGTGAVVVGPAQQVAVPDGGPPGAVTPIALTAHDNDRIASLAPLVPAADFSRPDATKSPGLQAIYKRGVIRVAYESDADAATLSFVRTFFNFMATSWKLKATFTPATPADAAAGIGPTFDVAAMHDPALVKSFPHTPLLADPTLVAWYMLHAADPFLDQALIAFVATDVASGDYGDLYRVRYAGAEPDYTLLKPILFGG